MKLRDTLANGLGRRRLELTGELARFRTGGVEGGAACLGGGGGAALFPIGSCGPVRNSFVNSLASFACGAEGSAGGGAAGGSPIGAAWDA